MKFDRLGVFPYSREEGTKAASLHPAVKRHVKLRRKNALMKAQREISLEQNRRFMGKALEVFVEGRVVDEPDVYVGRSYRDAPDVDGLVFFESARELESGSFVSVRVTAARDYDLIGALKE